MCATDFPVVWIKTYWIGSKPTDRKVMNTIQNTEHGLTIIFKFILLTWATTTVPDWSMD